jgi:hypothetical protein
MGGDNTPAEDRPPEDGDRGRLRAAVRPSDPDRLVEAFVARLAGVGGPDRNDGLVAVADAVADVLACTGWFQISENPS